MVIPSLLSCDLAAFFFSPVWQFDGWGKRGFGHARADDHQVSCVNLEAIERGFICFDDFPQVVAEAFYRGVTARFQLEFVQSDLPFGLVAAMLAGDLIEAALKRRRRKKYSGEMVTTWPASTARISHRDSFTSQ